MPVKGSPKFHSQNQLSQVLRELNSFAAVVLVIPKGGALALATDQATGVVTPILIAEVGEVKRLATGRDVVVGDLSQASVFSSLDGLQSFVCR